MFTVRVLQFLLLEFMSFISRFIQGSLCFDIMESAIDKLKKKKNKKRGSKKKRFQIFFFFFFFFFFPFFLIVVHWQIVGGCK